MDIEGNCEEGNLSEADKKLLDILQLAMPSVYGGSSQSKIPDVLTNAINYLSEFRKSDTAPSEASTNSKSSMKQITLDKWIMKNKPSSTSRAIRNSNNPTAQELEKESKIDKMCENIQSSENVSLIISNREGPNMLNNDVSGTAKLLSNEDLYERISRNMPIVVLERINLKGYNVEKSIKNDSEYNSPSKISDVSNIAVCLSDPTDNNSILIEDKSVNAELKEISTESQILPLPISYNLRRSTRRTESVEKQKSQVCNPLMSVEDPNVGRNNLNLQEAESNINFIAKRKESKKRIQTKVASLNKTDNVNTLISIADHGSIATAESTTFKQNISLSSKLMKEIDTTKAFKDLSKGNLHLSENQKAILTDESLLPAQTHSTSLVSSRKQKKNNCHPAISNVMEAKGQSRSVISPEISSADVNIEDSELINEIASNELNTLSFKGSKNVQSMAKKNIDRIEILTVKEQNSVNKPGSSVSKDPISKQSFFPNSSELDTKPKTRQHSACVPDKLKNLLIAPLTINKGGERHSRIVKEGSSQEFQTISVKRKKTQSSNIKVRKQRGSKSQDSSSEFNSDSLYDSQNEEKDSFEENYITKQPYKTQTSPAKSSLSVSTQKQIIKKSPKKMTLTGRNKSSNINSYQDSLSRDVGSDTKQTVNVVDEAAELDKYEVKQQGCKLTHPNKSLQNISATINSDGSHFEQDSVTLKGEEKSKLVTKLKKRRKSNSFKTVPPTERIGKKQSSEEFNVPINSEGKIFLQDTVFHAENTSGSVVESQQKCEITNKGPEESVTSQSVLKRKRKKKSGSSEATSVVENSEQNIGVVLNINNCNSQLEQVTASNIRETPLVDNELQSQIKKHSENECDPLTVDDAFKMVTGSSESSVGLHSIPKRKQGKRKNPLNITSNEKNKSVIENLLTVEEKHLICENAMKDLDPCQVEEFFSNISTNLEQDSLLEVSKAIESSKSNLESSVPKRKLRKQISKKELISIEKVSQTSKSRKQCESINSEDIPLTETKTTNSISEHIHSVNQNSLKQNYTDHCVTTKLPHSILSKKIKGKKLEIATSVQSSNIIDENVSKPYEKSQQQPEFLSPNSHFRREIKNNLEPISTKLSLHSKTTVKASKGKPLNMSESMLKNIKKSSKNSKQIPKHTKSIDLDFSTVQNELENIEIDVTSSELNPQLFKDGNKDIQKSSCDIGSPVIKSVYSLAADKLTSNEYHQEPTSLRQETFETDPSASDYEAFCIMQQICLVLGVNLEDLFQSSQLIKKLKANRNNTPEAVFFIQGHNLANGQIAPSVHVHESKKKIWKTLHKLKAE